MKLKVRTTLLLGFTVVVGLFALATGVTVASLASIARLEDKLAHLDHGKHEGHLTVVAVQEMYIHQAHSLIADDRSHLDHYLQKRSSARKRLEGLKLACSPAELAERVDEIQKTTSEMHEYFESTVVPELGQKRPSGARGHHVRLEALTQRAADLTDRLNAILEQQSEDVRGELVRVLSHTRWSTVLMLWLAGGVGMVAGFALVRRIGRPVAILHRAFGHVGAGHLDVRVDPEGPTELMELAQGFNEMTAALEESRQRISQHERMAAMGELAAGVAHELNNPLGVITGYLKLVRNALPDGQALNDLEIIADEVAQCRNIVESLLHFTRPRQLHTHRVDVSTLVTETIERMSKAEASPKATVSVSVSCSPLMAIVDDSAVRQVVSNLLQNALDAAGAGGHVDIAVQAEGRTLVITVLDSGAGISPEVHEHLFKPFRTTKPKGTGLGLAICDVLVKCHGGRIDVEPGPKAGTLFRVAIPQALPAEPTEPEEEEI